jgi:hypothetical protein
MKTKLLIVLFVTVVFVSCSGKIGTYKVSDLKKQGLTSEQIDELREKFNKNYAEAKEEAKAFSEKGIVYTDEFLINSVSDGLSDLIEELTAKAKIESTNKSGYDDANAYIKDLLDGKFSKDPAAFKRVVTPKLKECKKLFFEYGIKYPNIVLNQIIESAEEVIEKGKVSELEKNNNFWLFNDEVFESQITGEYDESGYYIYNSFEDFVRDIYSYQISLEYYASSEDNYINFIKTYYHQGYVARVLLRSQFITPETLKGIKGDEKGIADGAAILDYVGELRKLE